MSKIVIFACVLLVSIASDGRSTENETTDTPTERHREEIKRYATDALTAPAGKLLYPKRLARFIAQIDDILRLSAQYSARHRIDPLLVVYLAVKESGLRPHAVGFAKGERGYMQVHGKRVTKGFDLSKPLDQWHAGIKRLSVAFDACGGDLRGAITNYGTGRCGAHTAQGRKKMYRRYREFLRIRKKYRGTE